MKRFLVLFISRFIMMVLLMAIVVACMIASYRTDESVRTMVKGISQIHR